jgi:hypothetical protein
LLVILFNSSLEDPIQGFGNQDLSIIYDAISSAPGFAFRNTSTMPGSAVSRGVLRDWRWWHYLTVKAEAL